MPLGIIDDHKLEHVPGTAPLHELGRIHIELNAALDTSLLKHDKSGTIVLVPQPSDSLNDPLNWPRWKKEMFTVVIAYGCGCVGAIGPLLTPAFVPLSESFGVSLTKFSIGANGALILGIVVASLLCNTLAVKYGKRPIYLITTIGLAVTCFWAAEVNSFGSLTAARTIQGICMAPFEALIPASVADIWFVHERGFRMAIFNLGVIGGIVSHIASSIKILSDHRKNLAGPISGSVIQYGSYRVLMHTMGTAFVIMLLTVFFFMPETAYHRDDSLNIDTGIAKSVNENSKLATEQIENITSRSATLDRARVSYTKELLPWSGYIHPISTWRHILRPFVMLSSPVVLWATLLFTTEISWLVLIAISLSQIFSAPPYNFSVSAVGATNMSSFVASLLGTLAAGPIIDGTTKLLARRNNGIYEPEFRLPVMLTYLLFTATAFFGWGQSLSEGQSWPIPVVVCMGLMNFGIQLGTTATLTYVSDSHREVSAEAFAVMNFIKNIFAFCQSFYVNDWIANSGVRDVFFTIGGITIAVTLTTIPMYVFGKKARSLVHRRRLLQIVSKTD